MREGPVRREGGSAQGVGLWVTVRRVRIDPEERRIRYLRRLELLVGELDGIIADPEGFRRIQLDAMNVLIRAVRLCYRIVREVDVERLELELAEIKERNRRAKEGGGEQDLGYEVEEESAQ